MFYCYSYLVSSEADTRGMIKLWLFILSFCGEGCVLNYQYVCKQDLHILVHTSGVSPGLIMSRGQISRVRSGPVGVEVG